MAYNYSRNPLRVLQKRIGSAVLIRLKDGTEYKGALKEYDNFMNVILNNAIEIEDAKETGKFEEVFIRGNNIIFIVPEV